MGVSSNDDQMIESGEFRRDEHVIWIVTDRIDCASLRKWTESPRIKVRE